MYVRNILWQESKKAYIANILKNDIGIGEVVGPEKYPGYRHKNKSDEPAQFVIKDVLYRSLPLVSEKRNFPPQVIGGNAEAM